MDQFQTEIHPDGETEENTKQTSPKRVFLDFIETILLAVFLFLAINSVSARIRIESISMQPTLYADNFVIVSKLSYKLGTPHRGDIIVFRYPPDPEREPYIKRVIGLPGDNVEISNGIVRVNGISLDEPYIYDKPDYNGSWLVPVDSLFVLGDNRNRSSDSHSWGMVPLENVIGKALVVYWPPENWQLLDRSTAVASEP
jgi:signal peptidase I